MYNFLTIGFDCSPAAALRNINLRNEALPFDWVISNIDSLEKCFQDRFLNFHVNLKYNHNKTRLIDEYGFEFPHDYPLQNENDTENEPSSDPKSVENIGEGVIGEIKGKIISPNWENCYNVVKEKYDRRIQRFVKILSDKKPIIVLCRYNTIDVLKLRNLLLKYFNKQNVIFINSTNEKFLNNFIINCNTEINGNWNDVEIWKKYIHIVISNQTFYK